MDIHVSACDSKRVSVGAHRCQKIEPHPLELEQLALVSRLMWLLGIEFGFFARAAGWALNHRAQEELH